MPSRPRSSHVTARRLFALAAVLFSITWSFFAFGAGVTFSTPPIRVDTGRLATPAAGTGTAPTGGGATLYGINRQDCLGLRDGVPLDPRWQFHISPPGISYQYLEVWARTDSNAGCSDPGARGTTGLAPLCSKVARFTNAEVNASQLFEIPDIAMMAAVKASPHRKDLPVRDDRNASFVADKANRPTICSAGGSQDPINLYLSFLLVSDTAGTLAGGGTPFELVYGTTYDLSGPDGPTISTGAGNTLIKITWSTGVSVPPQNFLGYHAYCVDLGLAPDGGVADTATGSDTSGTDTVVADTAVADTAVADSSVADADADPDADTSVADTTPPSDSTASDSAASTDATAGTDAPATGPVPAPAGCGGALLPAGMTGGQLPSAELEEKYRCGDSVGPGAGSVQILGLLNNHLYAVAVAGLDTYSNPGTLSNIVCEKPRETVDFYDAFRDAGGTAGGGYCSYSPVGGLSGLGALGLSALGLAVRLVRRRRGSGR